MRTNVRRVGLVAASQMAFLVVAAPAAHAAPPTFSKAFAPGTIGPGSTATLTFTIDNSAEASAIGSVAFSDTLPAAVEIADPASASYAPECEGGGGRGGPTTLSAPAGGSTISFSSGAVPAGGVCTIRVDVTSPTPGTHTNTSGDLTSSAGNSGTATADLVVDTSLPGFSKFFSPATVPWGDRSTLTFTVDNSANASVVPNLDFTDTLPTGIVVADPSDASTDCGTSTIPPTLTAVPGSSTVTLDANGTSGFPAVAAGSSCTVTVAVVTTGIGGLDNVSGNLLAEFAEAGFAVDTLTVTRTEPLALRKEFTTDEAAPGDTTTLVFTVDNFDRDFAATGVAFTDDLDAALTGLTFTSLTSNTCSGTVTGTGTTDVSLAGGVIAASGSCTVEVELTVPGGATPGTYTNTTGTVSGTVDGSPVVGNAASDTLFVAPVPVFTKEWTDDPVGAGGTVTLEYTITNVSTTSGATDIEFIDDLTDEFGFPASVTLPPTPDPPCGGGSSLALVSTGTDREGLELTGGSLATGGSPGDSCTFSVTIDVPIGHPAGTYPSPTEELTATVDGSTVTAPPAEDDLVVIGAPRLTKEFTDDPVAPGGTVTLEFELTNPGESAVDISGIEFTDDLDATVSGMTANVPPTPDPPCGAGSMLTASAGDTLLTFAGGRVPANGTCTFSVTLNVPAGTASGTSTNTTSSVTGTSDGVAVEGLAASDGLVVTGLFFSKEFLDEPVVPGEATTLRFTIENAHPTTDATITFFTDNLDAALSDLAATGAPTSDDCGGSMSGTTFLVYTGGSVASGDTCTIDVPVLVPGAATPGTYVNTTSSLSFTQGGSGTAPPAVDDLVVVDGLIIGKEFTDDPVRPGDTATLEFTITNEDPDEAASAVAFTDDLDAMLSGATFESALFDDCGGMSNTPPPSSTFGYASGSLAAGATCTIRIEVDVPGGATPATYPNTTSDITGTIGGVGVAGDPATDDLVVEPTPTVTLAKEFTDDPAHPGGTATLEFTITNLDGSSGVTGLSFSDDLDATLTGLVATGLPASDVCGTGSSISGTSFLTLTAGDLGPSGICTFDVVLSVPAGATAGTYPNTTSDLLASGLVVGDPATDDLEIDVDSDLSVAIAPTSQVVTPGATATSTVTVTNTGPDGSVVTGLDLTIGGGGSFTTVPVGCTGGGTSLSCDLGTLASSATDDVVVETSHPIAGSDDLVATTSTDSTDPDGANDTATATITVVTPPAPGGGVGSSADLAVVLAPSSQSVEAGGPATSTATVSNNGPTASTATLTVEVSGAGDLASTPTGCTSSGSTVTCSLGSLASGDAVSIDVVTDHPEAGTATVQARVSGTTADPDADNDADEATITVTGPGPDDLADDCQAEPSSYPPDTDPDGTHGQAIGCLLALDIVQGMDDGNFGGGLAISRAQFALLLVRAIDHLGLNLPTDVPDAFDDDDGKFHEVVANRLAAADIFTGTGGRQFDGELPISRSQVAAALVRAVRALTSVEVPERADQFDDDDGTFFEADHDAGAQLRLVQGVGGGAYRGSLDISRSQVASIVARFVVLVGGRVT